MSCPALDDADTADRPRRVAAGREAKTPERAGRRALEKSIAKKSPRLTRAAWQSCLGAYRSLLEDVAKDPAQVAEFKKGRAAVRAAFKRVGQ